MENFDKESQAETQRLGEQLEDARREGRDIYQIARILQMLQARGIEAEATDEEVEEISSNLERARKGESRRPLPRGYEIARWLMIQKTFTPEAVEITDEDRTAIAEAFEEYRAEKNFRQIASLVKTAEFIGVSTSLEGLTEGEKAAIAEGLRTLE